MSRSRNYVFTLNNYTEQELFAIRSTVHGGRAKYIAFQGEIGGGGTKHLQGLAIFRDAVTIRAAGQRLGTARFHWECMRGTFEQALAYTRKPDTADPDLPWEEHGDKPAVGQGTRSDWEAIRDKLKDGGTLHDVAEEFPGHLIRCGRGIETLQSLYRRPRDPSQPPTVLWFWGPTGTGKSRAAHDSYPDAYVKMPANKWWDGYEQQPAVIIDDYRRDFSTFAELLRLLDRYPHRVEKKGASIQFNSSTIIITTPKPPEETWAGRTEEDLAQLMRRITEVREFKADIAVAPRVFADGFVPGN